KALHDFLHQYRHNHDTVCVREPSPESRAKSRSCLPQSHRATEKDSPRITRSSKAATKRMDEATDELDEHRSVYIGGFILCSLWISQNFKYNPPARSRGLAGARARRGERREVAHQGCETP